jgi:hypothetical protein
MSNNVSIKSKTISAGVAAVLLLLVTGGFAQKPTVKKIPAGSEFSGFLKDYKHLKPVSEMEGAALGYAAQDAHKNLHAYVAAVIDPVEVYLASDASDAKMTETARSASTEYFRAALVKSVSAAFPVVDEPGPLVLRLRAAVVGVDFGGETPAADRAVDRENGLTYTVNIGKVQVEMELLDSETGEQIAAFVDKENLGKGAEIGAVSLTRDQRWVAAREAFDGWANRVRNFLDVKAQLTPEQAEKADKSYEPYGS